jgi:hypothetical protein
MTFGMRYPPFSILANGRNSTDSAPDPVDIWFVVLVQKRTAPDDMGSFMRQNRRAVSGGSVPQKAARLMQRSSRCTAN